MNQPKVILVVMDGWGYSATKEGNAIALATLPTFNTLWAICPHTLLRAFGQNVGLPWGATGSSEVGHKSIGSGKRISQEIAEIDKEINSDKFFKNKHLISFLEKSKVNKHPIHLVGLVSNGGVHSHTDHILAILEFLKAEEYKGQIYLHAITDGRDTDPKAAQKFFDMVDGKVKLLGLDCKIATVCGRYFTMDRNNRWDRTRKGYLLLTEGTGEEVSSSEEALKKNYERNITDEFIEPMKIKLEESKTPGVLGKLFKAKEQNTVGTIKPGDNVFFFNIRADRMRQLVQMFTTEMKENGTHSVRNLNIITLTTYDERFPVTVIYPTEKIKNPLAKIISDRGLTQGHFAETEKYAHVTYFFNGGIADPFPKEDWYLIKSPDVATYDLAPEMSASKITDKVIEVLNEKMLDFVLINYANADMVGHTGVLDATIKACEAVDKELRRLIESFPGSTMLVTADHGNADYMFDPVYNEVIKTHSTNPVPFIVVGKKYQYAVLRQSGILADIAPTILSIMEIPTPNTFDGVNLIESNSKEEYEKKEEPKK